MFEETILNFVVVMAIISVNLILSLKAKIPILNIVSGLFLILITWSIGILPASPYFQLLATFIGIFTVYQSVTAVMD